MWDSGLINTKHGPRVALMHAGENVQTFPPTDHHIRTCADTARWLNHVARLALYAPATVAA